MPALGPESDTTRPSFIFAVKPTSVTILAKPDFVSAAKELEVSCQAVGGYPPPKLTWWMGTKRLRPYDQVSEG